MAQFFFPATRSRDLPGFYNVDAVVGSPPAANMSEDVLLVQFLLRLRKFGRQNQDIYAAVPLTGSIDSNTNVAITTFQERVKNSYAGSSVDGRISPAKSLFFGSRGAFTIAALNELTQRKFYEVWPRLDRMPECPGVIRQMVIRTLVGNRIGSE